MSNGNTHLIRKVVFEIGLQSQENAFQIQQTVSEAFNRHLLTALERIFDQRLNPDQFIQIEKVEIDLGVLSMNKLEDELQTVFCTEIDTFVASLAEAVARNQEQGDFAGSNVTIQWKSGKLAETKVHAALTGESNLYFSNFCTYLKTGILPPRAGKKSNGPLSEMIHEVLENQADQVVSFLRNNKDNNHILHRLALNMKVPQLTYLLSLLDCQDTPLLADCIYHLHKLYPDVHLEVVKSGIHLSFNSSEKFFWWLLLKRFSSSESKLFAMTGSVKSQDHPDSNDTDSILKELVVFAEQLAESSLLKRYADAPTQFGQLNGRLRNAIESVIADKTVHQGGHELNISSRKLLHPEQKNPQRIISDDSILLNNSLFAMHAVPDKSSLVSGTDSEVFADEDIYINNAGLVILAPFLKPFFQALSLINGKEFVSVEAQWKAAHLLQYACGLYSDTDIPENGETDMILNKILCGIPVNDSIPDHVELSQTEKLETEELLRSVLTHWTIMSRSSVQTLQTTFLKKNGRLKFTGNEWNLVIERDSVVEILIDRLPWPISLIKLPWSTHAMFTTW